MEDDSKVTPQQPMYTLYATLRNSGEQILMCETTSLETIESIVALFNEGKHIAKFSIVREQQEVYKEKVLKRKM